MYTDDDLNLAVEKGVFTDTSVKAFRDLHAQLKHSPAVDEENFRLIGGFNDIFIVIACALFLFSTAFALNAGTRIEFIGFAVTAGLSWYLAEIFVRQRKMALPAIFLLLSFVISVFFAISSLELLSEDFSISLGAIAAAIAAYIHWRHFKVAITIAACTACIVGIIASLIIGIFQQPENILLAAGFGCGLITFALAMYWDTSDTSRTTGKSDVAFWLHMLSAPLLIHPVFFSLGIFDGYENIFISFIAITLYFLITLLSVTIDRRAFMVSSLIYVLVALSQMFKSLGGVGTSLALTGLIMGGSLLMLSIYWHPIRKTILAYLPEQFRKYVPEIKQD